AWSPGARECPNGAHKARSPRGGTRPPPAHTSTMTTAGTTRSVPETGSPPTDGAAFLNAVAERIPDLRVLTDTVDRESYRHDETAYQKAGLPLAVALPTETAQVAELMRLASEHRIPVVPRGAGTGLSGGAAGGERGVAVE